MERNELKTALALQLFRHSENPDSCDEMRGTGPDGVWPFSLTIDSWSIEARGWVELISR